MQKHDLAKWLSGRMSAEELQDFEKSPEYASYAKIAKASKKMVPPHYDASEQWEHFKATQLNKQPKVIALRPLKHLLRVAAVLALLFTTYWYFNSQSTVVSTQIAQTNEVLLPDASHVDLNAGSELVFNDSKWNKKREVKLRGEAFFKVAKGQTFDVITDNGTVSVLGTQFNVKSRSNYFEVTCYEGLVKVVSGKKQVELRPGASFRLIDNTLVPIENTVRTSPSWIHDESSFKAVPFEFVIRELERQYGVNVAVSDVDIQQLFSGSFVNNNLTLALQSICVPLHLSFEVEDKSKVLIYETP